MSDTSYSNMTEKELEVCFYKNYRSWEEKFKEWVSDKTDRQMTIMEPIFFSWDKDIDIYEPINEPIAIIDDPCYNNSPTTIKEGSNEGV